MGDRRVKCVGVGVLEMPAWCCPPTTSPSTAGHPHDPLRLVPTVPDPDQPEIDDGVAGMVGAP